MPPCDIVYIHFLDADDMLSLDCIEQCVEHIGECDILWHDVAYIYEDNISKGEYVSLLETLHITPELAQTKAFHTLELWEQMNSFSFVHQGLFRYSILENLRFFTQLANEDALFGMILFAKAQSIRLGNFQGLIYRVHTDSVSAHGEAQGIYRKSYPLFMYDMLDGFGCDDYKVKHYFFSYSCTYVCLGLLDFISTLPSTTPNPLKSKLIAFLQLRAMYAFGGVSFESDPKNIRALLKPLEPYMQKVSFNIKLAYYMPRLYRILRYLKQRRKAFLPISKT